MTLAPRAFVDESYVRLGDDDGLYILAAVSIDSGREEAVRHRLRGALYRRTPRLHWRDDLPATRLGGLQVLAHELGVVGRAVVATSRVGQRQQERARQKSWWDLVDHLTAAGVADLVLEARQDALNERDAATLRDVQRNKAFRWTLGRPLDEPLLWLADYLAGITGARARSQHNYDKVLPASMVEILDREL